MTLAVMVGILTGTRRSNVAAEERVARSRVSLADAVQSAVSRNPLVGELREEVARVRAEIDVQEGDFAPVFRLGVVAGRQTSLAAVTGDGRIDDLYGEASTGVAGRFTSGTAYDFGIAAAVLDSDYNLDLLSPRYESSVSLTISQPLLRDLGFRVNRAPIRAAELAHQAAEASYASRVEELAAETARRYWLWSVAIAGVEVSQSAQALGQEQLRATQLRARAGAISPLEVAQAEATVAQREDDRRAAESTATQAEANLLAVSHLHRAPGFDWSKPLEPIDELPEAMPELDLEAGMALAIENRFQVKLQKKLIEAQEQLVIAAEDRVWPRLDLVGRAALVGVSGIVEEGAPTSAEFLSGRWPRSVANIYRGPRYEIGLLFSLPLDNSQEEGRAEQARRILAQARIRLEQQTVLVALDYRKSRQQLNEEQKRYAAAVEAERLTAINVEAERKKFAGGISTTFDVLRSQDDLSRARINTARALANLQLALVAVKLADGTLLSSLGVSPELPRP
jgi:outer membrane protein TolC